MGYKNISDIELPNVFPTDNIYMAQDWERFVIFEAKPENIRINPRAQIVFQEYLKKRFPDQNGEVDLTEMNKTLGTSYKSLHNVYPSEKLPQNPEYSKEWLNFLQNAVPAMFIEVEVEKEQNAWQNFLLAKYADVEALNLNWHEAVTAFEDVNIDWLTIDYLDFKANKGKIFREHLTRNYAMVLNEMFYNGRAMLNTLIYVSLAIATAVIVNPLAAYALSRFKIASSYKIILILMLTMAFPPMVMGIPNFLILKRLNMLNTFWALILPGLADGYFIFLLKGFFDSLPKELFESATVDGAGEGRIFWQIAMQLSKPIMAVIALGAFNAAYRNFMFAFIVCQDKSMWTMMVSIYQLMLRSAPGVGFAALVIAAIPTFLVFIFFQNIIIKGIVVPTEK
jgi:multiple sugar transport system permease protein